MSCVSVWVPNVSDFPTTELMQDNALKHGTQALELQLYAQACMTTRLRTTVTKQQRYIILDGKCWQPTRQIDVCQINDLPLHSQLIADHIRCAQLIAECSRPGHRVHTGPRSNAIANQVRVGAP